MREQKRHLFLIGPGGVGKTTVGPLIAEKLGRKFLDLDDIFCERLENISVYIQKRGYAEYVIANSDLFATLLAEQQEPSVMALSSGFLYVEVLPKTVQKNRVRVTANGVSILLQSGQTPQDGVETVVQRQLSRGFDLKPEIERKKYLERAVVYAGIADFRVNSDRTPEDTADAIMKLIAHQMS